MMFKIKEGSHYIKPTNKELTPTERKLMHLLCRGASAREIASQMGIAQATVKNHMTNIYNKLEIDNQRQAIILGIRMGFGEDKVESSGITETIQFHESEIRRLKMIQKEGESAGQAINSAHDIRYLVPDTECTGNQPELEYASRTADGNDC